MTTTAEILHQTGACSEAVEWVAAGQFATLDAAWAACERGDWMLWWAGKHSGFPESEGRRKLVLVSCECARLSLPLFDNRRPNDGRVRYLIETAEGWALGKATLSDVMAARRAAYVVDAATDAAAYASYVVDAATDAAAFASYAAAFAAEAAEAAAASTTEAAATKEKVLAQCADIVRKHYPNPPTT